MTKIRYAEDKPKNCEYCYWWGGKMKGCTLGEENCYYILPDKPVKKASPCDGCPYNKNNPCIGYCMKRIIEERRSK